MAALTFQRDTGFAGLVPARGTFPAAANAKVFGGALVVCNANREAIPGALIAGGAAVALGKASGKGVVDNTGGAAGAKDIEVEYGVFEWETASAGDLIAFDDIGKVAFVVDDQTVGLTDGGATRIKAGIIIDVRNGKPWVWMGPHVFAAI